MTNVDRAAMLESPSGTLEAVRARHKLDEQGARELVTQLAQWARSTHPQLKHYDDKFMENSVLSSKGSFDKARQRLDRYVSLRLSLGKYFEKTDVINEFDDFHSAFKIVVLPKLTEDYCRVVVVRIKTGMKPKSVSDAYKFFLIVAEYLRLNDCNDGLKLVLDYRDASMWEFLPKVGPIDVTNLARLMMECYGFRILGIHIVSHTTWIGIFVRLLKSVLSAKLGGRIRVHREMDTVFEVIPKSMMPSDYGGDERSIDSLYDSWLNELGSKEHVDYLRRMKTVFTKTT